MDDGDRRVSFRLLSLLVVLIVLGAGLAGGSPIADDPNDASGATTVDSDTPGIHETIVTGDGYINGQEEMVSDHPGSAYAWSTDSMTVNATLSSEATDEEYAICGEATDTDGEVLSDLGCQVVTFTGGEEEVAFDVDDWNDVEQEGVWITLELQTEDGDVEYYETVPVTLIHPEGDLSGDGLTNAEEVQYGTDFTVPDTTGNGLTDWEEVEIHGSDPLVTDTSGDGVGDATAVRLGLDPTIPYLPYVYVGGGLLVVVLVVAGASALGWHLMRRYTAGEPDGSTDSSRPMATDEPSAASTVEPTPSEPSPSESTPTPESDGEGPPLTKEEEVCRILRDHDGRMKQAELAEQTEWSQATVSRLLSKLESEGTVTKLRTGRENIVELEGREPESPNA